MKELIYPNVRKNYYFINESGEIFNIKGKKLSSIIVKTRNYNSVCYQLMREDGGRSSFVLARLLMYNFNYTKGCEEMQVNHIDCNTENNSLSNLEWVTSQENINHAVENGLIKNGSESSNSKLSKEDVISVIAMINDGIPKSKIANQFNVSVQTITALERRKYYREQTKEIEIKESFKNREYTISQIKQIKELVLKGLKNNEIAISVFGYYDTKHSTLIWKIKNNKIYTNI